MLPRLLIFLTGFFYVSVVHGQAYEPGVLITSKGDTLRGEVQNSFWVEPPTFIRFRPTADSPAQVFQPRRLRSVSFNRGRHFRYEVFSIDHSAETRLDMLPVGNVADVRVDSVLAEVLLDGPATVFRVVLPSATHYLVRRPDKPALDLSARLYLDASGSRGYTNGNNYRGQLGIYFSDCPAASTAARTAAFTPKGLVGVAQAYNQYCTPAQQQAGRAVLPEATPRRQVALLGGVLAGVRYNYVESSYPAPTCIDCKPHPFAGLYSELMLANRASAIYGELSTSTFQSQGLQLNQSKSVYLPFTYKAWLHTARLGVRFFFNLPREQQLLLGLNYELNLISNRSGIPSGATPDILVNQATSYATVRLPGISLGWRYKRLTVALDGQYYSSYDDVSSGKVANNQQFSLRTGLGYQLGRNPDIRKPGKTD